MLIEENKETKSAAPITIEIDTTDFLNNKIDEISSQGINHNIIKSYKSKKTYGEVIFKLAHNHYYVYENENIVALADELIKDESIYAIGVVSLDGKVKGIIIRKELFSLLGKPHGRDVFKNRSVKGIMKQTKCFNEESNIFNVAELLKDELRQIDNNYYLLVNSNNEFTGIFSTKNILIYLSDITQKDLNLAQRLQENIVKKETHLNETSIEVLGYSKMARGVGGDFYTIKQINTSRWILSLCDVSGKGMPASLLTCILGGMFNAYDFTRGLKYFVKILNRYVLSTFNFEKFITGIILDFNDKTGELLICDMGHSFIYLCKDNSFFKLKTDKNNFPIGVIEEINPVVNKYKFEKNDLMILFTDGIIEQTNDKGKEYSKRRLKKLIEKHRNKSLEEIKKIILDDLNEFKGDHQQHDDLTFLLFKYKG